MVTKEQLLERRAQLENDLAAQQQVARNAEQQRVDAISKLASCRDLINALSGAKQDVDHWLAQFPADPPATDAAPVETMVGKDGAPAAEPPKEPVN